PFMPEFKPQKSVTFHTNKATSPFVHSSNVFVGVMFLDFDRPDPGLNGNLASGPFGFLIEYPCSKPIGHPTRSSRVSADGLLRKDTDISLESASRAVHVGFRKTPFNAEQER